MLLTATEGLRTSSAVRAPAEPVIAAVQVIGRAVWVTLVVPENPVVLDDPVVPAAWAALVVPVALELAPAEVREPETVPVEAVPERDPVAVLLTTRSVTAVHRRALALGPKREEDMAVGAAETTPARAAKEAAKAWVAAE
jgi:hypothetical protein